jgi:hypothetical protein
MHAVASANGTSTEDVEVRGPPEQPVPAAADKPDATGGESSSSSNRSSSENGKVNGANEGGERLPEGWSWEQAHSGVFDGSVSENGKRNDHHPNPFAELDRRRPKYAGRSRA